jgi:acyl carrier protein
MGMKNLHLEADVRTFLIARIAAFTGGSADELDSGAELSIYGVDSTDLLTLMFDVEQHFSTTLHPSPFVEVATIDMLAQRIAAELAIGA